LSKNAAHGHGQGTVPIHQDEGQGAGEIGRILHNLGNVGVPSAGEVIVGEGLRGPQIHQFKRLGEVKDQAIQDGGGEALR
jgi:hypothetical protein